MKIRPLSLNRCMTVAIFFWAFIQNFILGAAIALFRRDGHNVLLASVFALTGANILAQYYFQYTNIKFTLAEIIFLPDIINYVVPALLYLYLVRIMDQKTAVRPWVYFLPAGVAFCILTTNVLLTENYHFFSYIRSDLHRAVLLSLVVWKGFILYRSVVLVSDNREALKARGAARYWWPRLLCFFLLGTALLAALNLYHMTWLAPYYPPSQLADLRGVIQFIFVTFNSSIVLAVIYFLIRHPTLLSGRPILKAVSEPEIEERDKNREHLLHAIEVEHIHLDNELNEKKLAEHLGIASYALSRLLNEEIGKSFSTFINEYRVQAAQRVLEADVDKEKTNYAIALESGFRSESVFYVNFKKITGTTPSKYRKTFAQGSKPALPLV